MLKIKPPSLAPAQKLDISALSSTELEGKVQSKYLERIEDENERLAVRIRVLESENSSLRMISVGKAGISYPAQSSVDPSDQEDYLSKCNILEAALDASKTRIMELEKAKSDADVKTDSMVCRLINEQEALENVIRSKDKLIEAVILICT